MISVLSKRWSYNKIGNKAKNLSHIFLKDLPLSYLMVSKPSNMLSINSPPNKFHQLCLIQPDEILQKVY